MSKGFLTLSERSESKGFAPILIVILIALGIGGYLLYQKQTKPVITPQPVINSTSTNSAETKDWKTSIQPNYSIKYPSDWTIKENSGLTTISNLNDGIGIMITAIDITKGTGDIGGGGQPSTTKEVVIGGVTGKELFFNQELTKTVNRMTLSLKRGNIYYQISVDNKNEDFSKVDQILSTFKFN